MGFEDLGKKISEIASTTAKKANEQVQIAKLNVDIAGVEKEIDGVYLAIGRYCYQKAAMGAVLEPDLMEYCADIDNLKKRIEDLQSQVAAIKAEGYIPREDREPDYQKAAREDRQEPEASEPKA